MEELEAVYNAYPRKLGKARGLAKARAVVRTPEQLERLQRAVKNYAAHVARDGVEERFVKHFSTFMGCWTDYLEPVRTAAGSSSPIAAPVPPSLPRAQQALPLPVPEAERASPADIQALVARVTGRVTGQA